MGLDLLIFLHNVPVSALPGGGKGVVAVIA